VENAYTLLYALTDNTCRYFADEDELCAQAMRKMISLRAERWGKCLRVLSEKPTGEVLILSKSLKNI